MVGERETFGELRMHDKTIIQIKFKFHLSGKKHGHQAAKDGQ